MYSEMMKIIESGLSGDKDRVLNYAKLLVKNLENEGNIKLAARISKIISTKNTRLVSLDSFSTKPVDQETRMDMVNVTVPNSVKDPLVFSEIINEEIEDFVNSYKQKEKLILNDLEVSNKLLLFGKPGTGKTSLATYISAELGLPLVTARLDGLVSSLLGSTAKNIRKVFDYAAKSPCVLFLDEFDVIAKVRDDKNELGELKRVVNSLLQNIDEFDNGSILIAATNHDKLLDPAVWRRFDKVIELNIPDKDRRIDLIKEFSSKVENNYINESSKLDILSKCLSDFSPADIKVVINNAIRKMVLDNRSQLVYSRLLYEIFLFQNRNSVEVYDLVGYLTENGITQKEINEEFKIPIRKVRDYVKKIKE
ncbi:MULTISPECIES: AAA family ATPase [Bacillus cereus group]|uniref:AAA family ATPase n=1 Tax=Bacillus cereus group TaxID=86661 RepID=UPI000BF54D0B|nr:AAA family ATPase [Bacillus wiedmannii]MEC2745164.1 AAA family ATPase [Bacillus cereus]MEC2754595.1 AAA family ATPase [Bacillus cereus]MEC2826162.1 AAA family ATPase [Bacillus cereus]PGD90901.1 ATPase [Bacillus wiedmannii]